VFAGQEHRLRCVIAPQTGWLEVTGASLDCPRWVAMDKARNRPCFKDVDALAISGYFGRPLGEEENKKAISTWIDAGERYAIDRAFAFLEHGGVPELKGEDHVDGAIALFRTYKKIADERGLELYVYEGGTHFGSKDPRLQDFLFKVTQDDRMRRLYTRLFEAWKEAGGTVFNCWGWIAPGDPWSNAQDVRDRRRTKYQAIVDFVTRHPCWWPRCDRGAR
jgi:hypothetical protein